MAGIHQYRVLSGAHGREQLLEHAKANGVNWEEHSHEGVNWMRASKGIIRHIDNGKEFDTDNMDEHTVRTMLDHYNIIRDNHKQTMVPHLRSAMAKLHADKGDPSLNPMDLIDEAHTHLKNNGGKVWADKLHTLNHLNTQIRGLNAKLVKMGKA
jgi:hypothetical protein